MKSCIAPLLLLLLSMTAVCVAQDIVTLDDGSVVRGKFIKDDGANLILQQANGETSIIAKARIRRMEMTQPPVPGSPVAKLLDASKDVKPAIGNRNNSPRNLDPLWAAPRIVEMDDLGSPELAKRKAALEKAKSSKDEYMLVMLAMLNPKMKTSEYTRIGILRAMLDFAPLSDEAAKTLAFAALFDPFPEAKREACRTIRYLQEDRAIRELVRYGGLDSNGGVKQAAAAALHEIDDNRIYASLVSAVPQPSVTANYGEGTGVERPKYVLPGGPGRLNMPIYLPSQPVTGVASDYGGAVVDFLKMLARKDMGLYPYAWNVWYREKVGEIGKEERDAYHDRRSMRERTNAP